ncbi:hypothetical protein M758_7G106100 [Ceratodon purpureus]|nr:hypothetical protein M758_7G106100 [Ceratodon purpureus]
MKIIMCMVVPQLFMLPMYVADVSTEGAQVSMQTEGKRLIQTTTGSSVTLYFFNNVSSQG